MSQQHKELWVSILERLKPTIQKANFITWFQHTMIVEKMGDKITLGLPTPFAYDWVMKKYAIKLLQAANEVDATIKDIDYEVCSRFSEKDNKEAINVNDLFKDDNKKVRKVRKANEVKVSRGRAAEPVSSRMLNDRYTLDNYIVGSDNRLPHAASVAVANTPGGIYNPLYIYGDVGLGKTHLVQAIGNEIVRNYPDMVVKYITAEKFVSEVVEAIGKRNTAKFKQQYRNVDCLLIDDIQFFARKHSSQQEFFHTFNELYDMNKQIVLTSDRPPNELDDLDDRLKSRFGMGMVVELLFPDYEARLAILQQKCQEFEVIIAPEVLSFIANNVHQNVRELEGVLRQAIAESQLSKRVPTIRSVAEIIKRLNKAQDIIGYDIENKARSAAKTTDEVQDIVANYFGISIDDLVGSGRKKEFVVPRQICMYLIKNELGYSYEKIGCDFGGRNHTTVMHSCNKTAKKLNTDLNLVRDVNAIKAEMGL